MSSKILVIDDDTAFCVMLKTFHINHNSVDPTEAPSQQYRKSTKAALKKALQDYEQSEVDLHNLVRSSPDSDSPVTKSEGKEGRS